MILDRRGLSVQLLYAMTRSVALILLLAATFAAHSAENLLRNGSFEGALLYWHGIDPEHHRLVRENAAVGDYSLRIDKGFVMSAPFVAKAGEPVTISFFVKGEKAGRVVVQMPPSAREEGTKAKRLWMREAEQSAKVTTEWQRVSFTWMADVPQSGFWPFPHYMVFIGKGGDSPIFVDGVTVTLGREPTANYIPRREVEAVIECPDLPGYVEADNIFERTAAPRIMAHASNPSSSERKVTLRWQLYDYEGERPVGKAVDKTVQIAAGRTVSESTPLPLAAAGCVLARVSVIDEDKVIDQSEMPLTSLPYPKAATKPDFRERFGGSFAGRERMLRRFQRIGFGWIRWFPETKWQNFQPKGPDDWNWHNEDFDLAARHGVSQHVVLYGWPKWIMDEGGHPLPRDMRWAPDDPKWDDLTVETAWDRFVKEAAKHFRDRSVVFEIQNEPEFDRWDKYPTEYAKFTIRTAKLIRQIAPNAKIMVNNVYGIPSGTNAPFFNAGGLRYIDIMSWHDYHAGWLTDAQGIKRMKQNMDDAGGKHVELWFNEGWGFTNTAVDQPIACTHLTSAQSTNEMMASVAEMTIAGQKKTILFHTGYEKHGMSFWDHSGPGTMLWDWYSYPTPLVAAWNVMTHHIGISDEVAFVRPLGANFCVFQDQRNGRGVMVAYADRSAESDAVVELPDFGAPLTIEDLMGNSGPAPKKLTLSKTGRPVFLYSATKTPGRVFADKLAPLDRKNASFVRTISGDVLAWNLPPVWEGKTVGQNDGSVVNADGNPVWKVEQIWPPDWKKPENFRPMVWTGTDWNVKEGGFGGQPSVNLKDGALIFSTRAPHGNPAQLRTTALVFVAPRQGVYELHGQASSTIWEGKNKTNLHILRKDADTVTTIAKVSVEHRAKVPLDGTSVELAAGQELVLMPQIDGMFSGGNLKLSDFHISQGQAVAASDQTQFRLPNTWEGTEKGSTRGNPISDRGQTLWRIDRLYPEESHLTNHYKPMPWNGTEWHTGENSQGGQPAVRIENGNAAFSVRGPWNGAGLNHAKTAALVFIAPQPGIYRVAGKAKTKPWEGGAQTYKLAILKKDTQRAAEVKAFELPRDGRLVALDAEIELSAGHELVFLPMMQGVWNNATTTTVEGLSVTKK